jgi:hypothetical protein
LGGLGVHATIDLAGGMKFGPDIRWTSYSDSDRDCLNLYNEKETFLFPEDDETLKLLFSKAIQKYYPKFRSGCVSFSFI